MKNGTQFVERPADRPVTPDPAADYVIGIYGGYDAKDPDWEQKVLSDRLRLPTSNERKQLELLQYWLSELADLALPVGAYNRESEFCDPETGHYHYSRMYLAATFNQAANRRKFSDGLRIARQAFESVHGFLVPKLGLPALTSVDDSLRRAESLAYMPFALWVRSHQSKELDYAVNQTRTLTLAFAVADALKAAAKTVARESISKIVETLREEFGSRDPRPQKRRIASPAQVEKVRQAIDTHPPGTKAVKLRSAAGVSKQAYNDALKKIRGNGESN